MARPAFSPKKGIPPHINNPEWVDLKAVAVMFNKSLRTVQNWVSDGTLSDIGVEMCRDPGGRWYCRMNIPRFRRTTKLTQLTQ